jgi:hypothetical protein
VGLDLGRQRHGLGRTASDLPGHLDRLLARRLDGGARLSGLQVVEERLRVEVDQLLGAEAQCFGTRVGSG